MSPRTASRDVRDALVDAAAQLLAEEGSQALTTRRLADMVGTSTMSVYTHFRGMPELRRTLRVEGFRRFAEYLDRVDVRDDAVAELVELAAAYVKNAARNPHLYRFMFMEKPDDEDAQVGVETFERLVEAVARAVDAGRFTGRPRDLALQLWVAGHGAVSLMLAGQLSLADAQSLINATALNLVVGFGDDPARARRSLRAALRRVSSAG